MTLVLSYRLGWKLATATLNSCSQLEPEVTKTRQIREVCVRLLYYMDGDERKVMEFGT